MQSIRVGSVAARPEAQRYQARLPRFPRFCGNQVHSPVQAISAGEVQEMKSPGSGVQGAEQAPCFVLLRSSAQKKSEPKRFAFSSAQGLLYRRGQDLSNTILKCGLIGKSYSKVETALLVQIQLWPMEEMVDESAQAPVPMAVGHEADVVGHLHGQHAAHHFRHTAEGLVVDEQGV